MADLSRTKAWSLVTEHVQSESLRKHLLAVEAAVRGYARSAAGDSSRPRTSSRIRMVELDVGMRCSRICEDGILPDGRRACCAPGARMAWTSRPWTRDRCVAARTCPGCPKTMQVRCQTRAVPANCAVSRWAERQVTQATRSRFVAPGVPKGSPAVMTTLSPDVAKPSSRAISAFSHRPTTV